MEQKYCVFIDVLGTKNIIQQNKYFQDTKISILNSIFSDLASSVATAIEDTNQLFTKKIFIRSFSDSIYLHCDELEPLIYATDKIFNAAFNMYSNFTQKEEYTPFIRAGIAKGWVVDFKDIGGIINKTGEVNPVGLGVVNAYETSEKSNLSGMRIILSMEVFNDLQANPIDTSNIHYKKEIDIFHSNVPTPYYLKQISEDRCGNPTHLYELIWSYQGMNTCTYDYVDKIKGIAPSIPDAAKKHLKATAQVLLDGLLLTDCNSQAGNKFSHARNQLEQLIK